MYNEFFRFRRTPFSIAPDPGFLYLSARHREALAHLLYGLKTDGGFVLVTGEVGTGKTTLIRSLIDRVPENLDLAFILNPRLSAKELLQTLCDELHVPVTGSINEGIKPWVDALTQHLLASYAAGRSTVMIIDEAQNLAPDVLEQIRLLTNLETSTHKLLRIILVGQPELDRMLDSRELRQLSQRITARCHLGPLSWPETRAYVAHRLTLAGGHPGQISHWALRTLYQYSGGVPRLINLIADRALLGAYVEANPQVSRTIAQRAAMEVLGQRQARRRRWQPLALGGAGAALVLALALWALLPAKLPEAEAPLAATTAQTSEEIQQTELQAPPPETDPLPAQPPAMAEEPEFLIIQPGRAPQRSQALPTREQPPAVAATANAPPATEPASAATETSETMALTADLRAPANLSSYLSQRQAFAALFQAWGRQLGNGVPCNQAPEQGLQCLRHRGDWNGLLRLNRPALLQLTLEDADGQRLFAALLRIQDEHAWLQLGDALQQLTVSELAGLWSGNAVLLWEMPPDYRGSIRRGDQQPSVGWLRQQLTGLGSENLSTPLPDQFDRNLELALRQFQRSRQLDADGIAGPQTWIMLANARQRPPLLHTDPTSQVGG